LFRTQERIFGELYEAKEIDEKRTREQRKENEKERLAYTYIFKRLKFKRKTEKEGEM